METLTKNMTSTLNDLIEINNDRIEGYDTASKETKDQDLKMLFSEMSATSRRFKEDLAAVVARHDGKIERGTTTSGKLYRVWMDIKSALAGKDRKTILSSCEFGEDAALGTYSKALKENDLPADIRLIVEKQRAVLQESHNKIKSLRDSARVL